MRFSVFSAIIFGVLTAIVSLPAQTTLFEENFNNCTLPPGWTVDTSGGPGPVWYVDVSQDSLNAGQSIDGSCFLFIDDYLTKPDTPGYVLTFTSPAFDVTPYTTVECTMDVYFRFGEDDFLQILVTDGVTETELARFDNYTTNGVNMATDHFSLKHDLALVSQSATTRLVFRYSSPYQSRGKYAGIDNIRVTGSGDGVNLIRESFDACTQPAGWETEILGGPAGWEFGRVPLGSSAFYDGNSMDGSCFVFFDDSELGDSTLPSAIRLYSPWFDGDQYFNYELNTDVVFRFSGTEHFAIYLQSSPSDSVELFRKSNGQIGGPFFPQYRHLNFDLSAYRAPQLRLVFEYDDGGAWGYWAGVDNVKVTARGLANENCSDAIPLLRGDNCLPAGNRTALFDGPLADCAGPTEGSLWYSWQADYTGVAKLSTVSGFNDVINVYTGACANLQPLLCNNRDEHGFAGESSYLDVQAGTNYLFRASGRSTGFGVPRGELCIELDSVATFPAPPVNDDCAQAVVLSVNSPCVAGNNLNANMSASLPSGNLLARADVWYTFTADSLAPGEYYELQSNASFSDVITVYEGGCAALQELATNHQGVRLVLPQLTPGQTYQVQIAGNFATAEGSLCPELLVQPPPAVPNDDCFSAVEVTIGGPCVAGNNTGAGFSGLQPPCVVLAGHDIWFKFTAPVSGAVQINTGADFRHVLTIWRGDCGGLHDVFCTLNPQRCDGYVVVGALNSGETYYVQIATWLDVPGRLGGNVCLEILDGNAPSGFEPLQLSLLQPCAGIDLVQLNVSASGGTPPYSFTGDTTGQLIASGQPYLIAVTDAAGCETYLGGTAEACDSVECTLSVSLALTDIMCYGASDGALNSQRSGGLNPVSYEWSTGAQTANLSGLPAGTYTVTVTDLIGCAATASATVGAVIGDGSQVVAAVKVFLQGPYVSGAQLMHDSLRVKNLIPLLEPYTALDSFTHTGGGGGEQTTASVLAVTGPNAIVDWVFLELRDAADPALVLATRSALLQRDGDVVDVDGVSPVRFGITTDQYYYLAVRHRNHFGVQSGVALLYPECVVETDFTTLPPGGFYAYNGQNPAQKLIDSRYVLWAGNGRVDYQLKYNGSSNDRTTILSLVGLTTPNSIVPGYELTDFNLDGQVKYNGSANDRNVLLGNIGILTPLAVLYDQVAR